MFIEENIQVVASHIKHHTTLIKVVDKATHSKSKAIHLHLLIVRFARAKDVRLDEHRNTDSISRQCLGNRYRMMLEAHQKAPRETLLNVRVVNGAKGIRAQRNAIHFYFAKGQRIIEIDDDIESLL